MDIVTYALCKKFVKKSLAGLGALRGSPCQITSIEPIYSTVDPTVVVENIIHLRWDENVDSDPAHTPAWHAEAVTTLDNGRGIYNIEYDPAGSTAEHNKYVVTFYDGTTDEFFIPTSSGSLKKKVVPVLPSATDADHNTIYLVPIASRPGTYEQWLTVENDDTHAWEWLSLGTTDVDLSLYQQKIDTHINRSYKNYDESTKAEKPNVPNVVGAINEHQDVLGTTYDYGSNKIIGLNTFHNASVLDALNDVGDIRDYEEYDSATATPTTVVEEINKSNKIYTLESPSSIDRTKYIEVQQLKKDNRDGSPIIQIGDDIVTPRVDIKQKSTPETGDFRTYDLYIANELVDPDDASAAPFGKVKIPTVKIVKETPPSERTTDTFVPATWTNPSINTYRAEIKLSHIPYVTPVTAPYSITITPVMGGTAEMLLTSGSSDAVLIVTDAGSAPIAGTTSVQFIYDGENAAIASQYYLEVEGKDWSLPVCGSKIEISKQLLIKDAGVNICTEEGVPLPQLHVGDKYLWLQFELPGGTSKFVYIAVKDMLNEQVGYKAIHIEYNALIEKDEVKLYIDDPDGLNILTQSVNGLAIAKASIAQYGVSRFATTDEVLGAASTPEIVVRPYDIYNFLNNSESVKDDINTYADATTGEKINKTVISAINESLTTKVTRHGVADEGDISTYSVNNTPESGITNILGDKIHDVKQIIVTDSLVSVADPVPYFIYRLTDIEGENEPGLYMYDAPIWVKVNGDPAIRTVEELPTTNIKLDCFYKLKVEDTILGVFDITEEKKADGYFCDKDGIHYRGEIPNDWTWIDVQSDWLNWYGDKIEDSTDGPISSVQHHDGTTVLEYKHKDIDNKLYYYHNSEWYEISPVFINKYMDADENFITNIDADEFKRQEPSEKGKTWIVQADGTWDLGMSGGLIVVSELPEIDDAAIGTAYYLNTSYRDSDTKELREIGTYTIEEYTDSVSGDILRKWSVVGMPNPNAYDYIKKLNDYLYEAHYGVIDFDYSKEFDELVDAGACTVAKKNNIVLRNFDWFYDDVCEFITHTPATVGGRHAVIGVCGTIDKLTKDIVEAGKYSPYFKLVPYKLLDGINDSGLMMAVLVCPYETGDAPTTGTLPSASITVNASYAVRYILDNCSNIDDAFNTFSNKVNWFVSEKTRDMGYELHFFVADASGRSGYLYFKDNSAKYWEFTETHTTDVKTNPIVTNFKLDGAMFYTVDGYNRLLTPWRAENRGVDPYTYGMTPHSAGVERYDLIFDDIRGSGEWSAMSSFGMHRYQTGFTGLYEARPGDDNFTKFSDLVGVEGLTYADPISTYRPIWEATKTAYLSRERNGTFWQTVHTSYYDLDKIAVTVFGQEALNPYNSTPIPWAYSFSSLSAARINGHEITPNSTSETLEIKKTLSLHDYGIIYDKNKVNDSTIYFVE